MSQNIKDSIKQKISEDISPTKNLSGLHLKIVMGIAIIWTLFQLWYASPFPFWFNFGMFKGLPARAIHLGFALTLTFLIFPIARGKKISFLDILISLVAAFCCLYIYFFYDDLVNRGGILLVKEFFGFKVPVELIIGTFGILILLEATRRAIGLPLVIIAICFFISLRTQKNWNIRPWLVVGALWCIFSFRELYYLFGNFTQYYPGSWQLERRQLNIEELFLGSLTDWGLIDGSSLSFSSISIRSLYILVLAISVWRAFILKKIDVEWMISVFAPFVVLLAPLALQILTGYRTNSLYSKTYILGIFFFAWYPAYLLTHSDLGQFTSLLGRQYNRIATILMFLTLGWIVVDRVGVKNIYKSNLEKSLEQVFSDSIPDREIVAVLRRELSSVELNEVIGNPIMYLYYEPGTSLRLYLGGEFLKDIDFWSVPVREKILISKSFKELLHHLNYPNVYIGLMKNGKVPDFGFPVKASLISEIENYSSASWFKQAFKYKNAMFFITQKPVH